MKRRLIALMLCSVPHCGQPQTFRFEGGLCKRCLHLFHKCLVPHAGFIPSTTLRKIARKLIKESNPTKGEIRKALRIARGTRHREGLWEDRPPYRLTPLLTGTPAKRRPQLLVGKRTQPNLEALVSGLVHEVLLEDALDTGFHYAHALAGMTYLGTRGLYAPPGVKPDQGPWKHSIYRLNVKDFSIVGTVVTKSCREVGLEVKSRDLRAQIVGMYLTGKETGDYREPVYPPRMAMRTTQVGDSPFDFRMPRKPWVPAHLKGKIVRAGGTCEGQTVSLPPMLPKPQYRSAAHKVAPKVFIQQPRREAPPTDWIFQQR